MPVKRQRPPANSFAGRVLDLRESHGLTQPELAKLIGIKQSSLSVIESGRTQPDRMRAPTLAKLVKALDTSLAYLKTGHAETAKQDALSPQEQELLDVFRKIKSPRIRALLISRAKGMLDSQVVE